MVGFKVQQGEPSSLLSIGFRVVGYSLDVCEFCVTLDESALGSTPKCDFEMVHPRLDIFWVIRIFPQGQASHASFYSHE